MIRAMSYTYTKKQPPAAQTPAPSRPRPQQVQGTAPTKVPFPFQFLGMPAEQRAKYKIQETPYRGVNDSLDAMDKMAREGQSHPEVRRYAEEVIRQVYPKDYLSELAALYYDVCRRVRYTRDPAEREYIQHPAITLRHRSADCDDQAILLRAALGALGLAVGNPVEYVTIGFDKNAPYGRRYTHVFVRSFDSKTGQWVVVDPVAGPNTRDMLKKAKVFTVRKM